MSRAKTAMEELRKKYGSPSVKDEDEQKRTPQTQATQPASAGTKSRAKAAMEEMRRKYESNPKAWTPTATSPQTTPTTPQNTEQTKKNSSPDLFSSIRERDEQGQGKISSVLGGAWDYTKDVGRQYKNAIFGDEETEQKPQSGATQSSGVWTAPEGKTSPTDLTSKIEELDNQRTELRRLISAAWRTGTNEELKRLTEEENALKADIAKLEDELKWWDDTGYDEEAERLYNAAMTAGTTLEAKRDSGKTIAEELDERQASISGLEDTLKRLEETYRQNPSDAVAAQYEQIAAQYNLAVNEFNALYAEYEPLANQIGSYNAFIDLYGDNVGKPRKATFKDLTLGSLKRGYINSQYGEQSFLKALGLDNEADKYAQILAGDEYQYEAGGSIGKAFSGAMEQAGQFGWQWTNPETTAAVTAATTAAFIAGQLGPQVLLPEEAITVPAAATAAFKFGSAYSNLKVEAGLAYQEMLEQGVSEGTARLIALAVGGVNAKLEDLQVDDLIKGLRVTSSKHGMENMFEMLLSELRKRAPDVANNVVQEIAQEGTTILGTQLGNRIDNGEWAYDADEWLERLKDTAISSTLTFSALNAPGTVFNVAGNQVHNNRLSDVGSQYEHATKDLIETGLSFAPESDAHKVAQEVQGKVDAGQSVTDLDRGRLVAANQKAIEVEESLEWANTPREQTVDQSIEQAAREAVGLETGDASASRGVVEDTPKVDTQPTLNEEALTEAQNAKQSVPYNAMSMGNPERSAHVQRQESAKKILGYGNEGVKLFNELADTGKVDAFKLLTRFDDTYQAGLTGAKVELTSNFQREVYNAGRMDGIALEAKRKPGAILSKSESGFDFTGAPKSITQEQKNFADLFAKKMGVKGYWDGQDGKAQYNAFYNSRTGGVAFAQDFGIDPELMKKLGSADFMEKVERLESKRENSFVFYLAHEIADHVATNRAPEAMRAFNNAMYNYKQKQTGGENLARSKQMFYGSRGVALTTEGAIEEVGADSILDLYDGDENAFMEAMMRIANGTDEQAKKGARTFRDILTDIIKKLKAWAGKLTGRENAEAKANVEKGITELERLRDMFEQGIAASMKAVEEARATKQTADMKSGDKAGVAYDAETESAYPTMLSLKTWTESEYVRARKQAAAEIAKALGISEKQALDYIDSVNSIAKMIADDRVRLDYEASPGRSSFVSNAEYGGSVDFSTICKKRRLFTGTFEAIQEALPNTALTAEEILEIRSMMDKKGYEVSCGLCYVEGSRANMGQYTKQFIERYKATNPEYVPNMAEMNTATGQEKIRREHPEVYEAYEYFMNHYGRLKPTDKALFASQQKPKMYQMATEYKGEILNKFGKRGNVEQKNANGGLRLQSFSDFEIIHLIDSMQVIMDMSRVGLAGQAYTKVPDFAWALGGTGLKINLSLIAKGVDRKGNLILDEKEGMREADAMALREQYSENVGTIIVVFTDRQMKAAMADPRIDYIIPFHRSQWKTDQYEVMGLPANAKDYTPWQNEAYINPVYNEKGKKLRPDNYMPNTYWDFSKSGKENAEAYLKMCAENNRRPKFHYLLKDNGNGSYSLQKDGSTDGYWKLLIDFKMYDNDGNGVPQRPVRPDFNMEQAQRMLNEYTGGHSKFPAAKDVVDEFVKKFKQSEAEKSANKTGRAEDGRDTMKYSMKNEPLSYETEVKETGLMGEAELHEWLNKQRKATEDYGLSKEQAKGIAQYVGGAAYEWTAIQRGEPDFEQTEYTEFWIDLARSGFELLPSFVGRTFRNLRFSDEGKFRAFMAKHAAGRDVQFEAFTSASKDPNGYVTSGPFVVHMVIDGISGKDISDSFSLPQQKEVVYMPGAVIHVDRHTIANDGHPLIYTREVIENGKDVGTNTGRVGENSPGAVDERRGGASERNRRDGVLEGVSARSGETGGGAVYQSVNKYSLKGDPNQMEQDLNDLRRQRAELQDEIDGAYLDDLPQADIRKLENRMYKLEADIDKLVAQERRAAVRTSMNDILSNLSAYRRSDLESLAEQVSDGNWDDYEDMSRTELEDALREAIESRELNPLEMQSTKYGLYVRPVSNVQHSLKGEKSMRREIQRIREEGAKSGKSEAEIESDIMGVVGPEYGELIKTYGQIKRGERAAREIEVPRKTEEDRHVSQTIRTVLEAEATPDAALPTIQQLIAQGDFSYDVITDKAAMAAAKKSIRTKGYETSLAEWLIDVKAGKVSKANTALGWELYNQAATAGDLKTAMTILDGMIKHQRNAAQAVQATRILKKLSPDAQLYGVKRSVDTLQEELTAKYGKKAPDLEIDEALAKKLLEAKTDKERDAAMRELYQDIGRQVPSTFADKWNAWRYLAMLGNPRTHVRNIVGNLGFALPVATKDLTATAIESMVSFVSGGKIERTKGMPGRDLLKAAWADYANVADQIAGSGKYNDAAIQSQAIEKGRVIFKTKLLEKARKGNSTLLEMEDVWFARPHYAFALAQYCKANGITADQMKSGKALGNARAYAIKEAQKATYRDTNAFSETISQLGRYHGDNVVKKGVSLVMEGILPFRKTPANILVRGLEYSPMGLLKSLSLDLVKVKKGEITAAEAIDNVSAGLTGTGLLALGFWAAAEGLIRGAGGGDEEEKKFEELQGHQSYALELPDGTSVTLDWLAPEVLPMFVGVNLYEMAKDRKGEYKLADILTAVSNVTEPLLEMSCLQSLNDVFDSVGYASTEGLSALPSALASAATSYLTQAFPTILGQAERSSQDVRMTTYTEKNDFLTSDMQYTLGKVSAKLPGWDYHQIPYIDAWGRTESTGTTGQNAANNFLNPAYTSQIETSAMEEELLRLYNATGESMVLPDRALKYFNVGGERKDLTAEEYVKYATEKGQLSYKVVTALTGSAEYKSMTDSERVEAIDMAYDYANAVAKTKVSAYKPDGWIAKAIATNKKTGLRPEKYIPLYMDQKDIESLKDSDGDTISNSKGLLIMQMIYSTKGLTSEQKQALFVDFGVGKTVIHYNPTLVNQKLAEMRKK